ncbi:MAG: hypothetical protein ACTSU5_09420 [Promethearchaeota archaeon]
MYSQEANGFTPTTYPPFYIYQSAAIVAISGATIILVRMMFILYDFALVVVLYKFANLIVEKRSHINYEQWAPLTMVLVNVFSPFAQIFFISAPHKVMGQLLFVLGMYLFYKEHWALSSTVLSLGFLTEIYPVFAWIIILLYLLARRMWRELFSSILFFGLTTIAVCLPFVLMDPITAIESLLSHFSNVTVVISLWDFIPWENSVHFLLFGKIEIGLHAIVILSFMVVFYLWTYHFFRTRPSDSKNPVLLISILFILSLSLVFLSLNPMFLYWVFSTCTLFTTGSFERVYKASIISSVHLGVFSLTSLVIFPGYSFLDILSVAASTLSTWDLIVWFVDIVSLAVLLALWYLVVPKLPFYKTRRDRNHISLSYYFTTMGLIFFIFLTLIYFVRPSSSNLTLVLIFLSVFLGGALLLGYVLFNLLKKLLNGEGRRL